MAHFVFITHGSTGDVVPVIRLAESAVKQGHRATLIASHHWREASEARGIRLLPIPPEGSREELSKLMEQYSSVRNPLTLLQAMYRHVDQWQEKIVPVLEAALADADALASSYLFPIYDEAARRRGIPTISLHFCPNTYFSKSHPPDNLPQLPSWVPDSLRYRWNESLSAIADRYVTKKINQWISRDDQRLERWLRSPSDYSLVLAPPNLYVGRPGDLPETTRFTGFVSGGISSDSASPAPTISRGPLLTFGSVTNDAMVREFRHLYKAWPESQPLTIQAGWFSPPKPPENKSITVIGPCPHGDLFPQASMIIHHGGAGTTTSAFLAGRPQIIIPHFADQPYWARTVKALHCGAQLRRRGWGRKLPAAAEKIHADPEFQHCAREFAAEQAPRNGADEGIRQIEDWISSGAARRAT